jgi:hypothetical protein
MKKSLILLLALLTFITACNKDADDTMIPASVNIKAAATFAMSVPPDSTNWLFESENFLIAAVSAKGVITANLVGTTTNSVRNPDSSFLATCSVTVLPKHAMYTDRC